MTKTYLKTGLYKYKINRPLSAAEEFDHLPQTEPSRSTPWFQLTVIRMNSTYLECVDRYFNLKGALSAYIIPSLFLIFWFFAYIFSTAPAKYSALSASKQNELILAIAALLLMATPLVVFMIWALRLECFRFTHYPMRFNRKTRMVHVFRPNGAVLSVPWDKVFFTLMYHSLGNWEVVGHLLSEDGQTVLDTFPLSMRSIRDDDNPDTLLYQQWEFVRQYMENGPEKLYNQVSIVMAVADKKETFLTGCKRIFANFGTNPLALLLVSPILLCVSIGRWIAMRTCKIPRWPDEIEAECQIEPGDPYIRDEHHLAD